MLDLVYVGNFLRSAFRLAAPLCFPALGEGFLEQSGSLNIGLEGLMLLGAWGGLVGAHMTGSPWIGLLLAMLMGLAIGAIQSLMCIHLHSNEVVTGMAINLLGLGATSYGHRVLFGIGGTHFSVPAFQDLAIPVLSKLPIVGRALFDQPAPFYLMIVVAFALWFVLNKTSWGLDIKAAGEDPWVAEAEGADVYRIRLLTMLLAGMLAAMGGAFITLYNVHVWFDGLTAGRGFIALAIPVIGRWNPLGILVASAVFGASEALGLTLQARLGGSAPFQLLMIIPFLITMLILPRASAGKSGPSALGRGYERGTGQ